MADRSIDEQGDGDVPGVVPLEDPEGADESHGAGVYL
jgi:hypothetical protein